MLMNKVTARTRACQPVKHKYTSRSRLEIFFILPFFVETLKKIFTEHQSKDNIVEFELRQKP